MSVKYRKGPDGKFQGRFPDEKSMRPSQPFPTGLGLSDKDLDARDPDSLNAAWMAYERSKKNTGHEDPLILAKEALNNYRNRVNTSMGQDDLYEAQEIYHSEIANIPLGNLDTDISHAWEVYRSMEITPVGENGAGQEPHGWIVVVAAHSDDPKALEQVWEATNELCEVADDMDPRLDSVDAARLQILEYNDRAPTSIFIDAYGSRRLESMSENPESDYSDHLVRLPVSSVVLPRDLRTDVARRICEWAERSSENAEDIDDATRDASGLTDDSKTPLIPVLMTDIDSRVLAPYRNSKSRSVAASIQAADSGYRLMPQKI